LAVFLQEINIFVDDIPLW